MCDYTEDELAWLSLYGHATTGAPLSTPSDMDNPEEPAHECAIPGEKWCGHLGTCISGPCGSKVMQGEEKKGPVRSGLVGAMTEDPPHIFASRMNNRP